MSRFIVLYFILCVASVLIVNADRLQRRSPLLGLSTPISRTPLRRPSGLGLSSSIPRPQRRPSGRALSTASNRAPLRRLSPSKRQLNVDSAATAEAVVKSLREVAAATTEAEEELDLEAEEEEETSTNIQALKDLQSRLPDVSVWALNLEFDEDEDFDADFESSSYRYLMLTKIKELEIDEKYLPDVDPLCLVSKTPENKADGADSASTSASEAANYYLNTTMCPCFDVTLQIVNSIWTRLLFSPDGELVPLEFVSTDYVGSLENMEQESLVLAELMFPETLELKLGDSQTVEAPSVKQRYDTLIWNEFMEFTRIPGCTSADCFRMKIFADSEAFWSLDALPSTDEAIEAAAVGKAFGFLLSEIDGNVGVWTAVMADGNVGPETTNLLIQPQYFNLGLQPNNELKFWDLSSVDGAVTGNSFPEILNEFMIEGESESSADALAKLKSIVSTATSVKWNFSQIPYSMEVASSTEGSAQLYLSFIGE